jgi:hypothetical protein
MGWDVHFTEHALIGSLCRAVDVERGQRAVCLRAVAVLLGCELPHGSSNSTVVMPPGARLVIASALLSDTRPTPAPQPAIAAPADHPETVCVADACKMLLISPHQHAIQRVLQPYLCVF